MELAQLRQGRDGIRLVGDGNTLPDGTKCLGMVVPHVQWRDIDEWAEACAAKPEQPKWVAELLESIGIDVQ